MKCWNHRRPRRRRLLLVLGFIRFFLNHSHRAHARYLSFHRVLFLTNAPSCQFNKKSCRSYWNRKGKKPEEHRRLCNMRMFKKETGRCSSYASNPLFLALPTLWFSTIIQRTFLFCICSLTVNERARRRSHPFTELVVAFFCNRSLFFLLYLSVAVFISLFSSIFLTYIGEKYF